MATAINDAGQYVPPRENSPFGLIRPLRLYSPAGVYSQDQPGNPDYLVRANAAIALGRVGDQQAIPALTIALKDGNPWMQLATAWALRQLGQTRGLAVVGRLLQHPDPSVHSTALIELTSYGLQTASYIVPYLSSRLDLKDDDQRNEAIIQAGWSGAAALGLVPKLRVLLTARQKNSPGYAATVLGNIAESTAVAWRLGDLSGSQHNQAIAEFTKVLAVMEAPGARFNRPPVNHVRDALVILKAPVRVYLKRSTEEMPRQRLPTPPTHRD